MGGGASYFPNKKKVYTPTNIHLNTNTYIPHPVTTNNNYQIIWGVQVGNSGCSKICWFNHHPTPRNFLTPENKPKPKRKGWSSSPTFLRGYVRFREGILPSYTGIDCCLGYIGDEILPSYIGVSLIFTVGRPSVFYRPFFS